MSDLQPGTIFGRDFRVVKALRAGGMGAVYIVDQLSTGKQRALKVMAPELASDPATRERFVLEARAGSKIDSDHVVEVVTAGVDEETGSPFLVMELLKGEELADCLERVGPLPLGDVAEIFQQVGHALEQAHAQGIVHRDLKPENIFLAVSRRRESNFTAKILDFGIAKLVADSQKTGTQPLGSPLFMSPEQTDRKGRISPATDVWALGLIAFRLLTGRDFWVETDSLPMLLREMCVNDIPFASERAAELGLTMTLPHGFDAWFARCVNRDIDARFPEAGEAVRAFAELVDSDAPRGAVVITGGRSATGNLDDRGSQASATARTALSDPPPSGVKIRPATGAADPVSVGAATVGVSVGAATGVTGDPMIATGSLVNATPAPVAPKSNSKTGVIVGIAVFAAIGAGVAIFRDKGEGPTPPTPSAPASHQASPALPSSAAPIAAAEKTSCPAGMILIKGGKMFMGARDLDDNAAAKPPHEVMVPSYCLDKTEVTTGAYQTCVDKGECERALEQVSWPNLTDEKKKRYSPFCNAGQKDRLSHPINCVAWPMADNFCKKAKHRLPTEAEWEFAARGSSQRKYPWGDDPPNGKFLNACGKECSLWGDTHAEKHQMMFEDDDGFPATAPVGSFPAGASAQGVMDLAGNVWEWTADYFAPYGEARLDNPKGPETGDKRVVRGGDFFGFQADWARPAWRWKTDPETYNHAIGFRCAADPR